MILVTGATGHLGANLVRRLLADGHEVRALLQSPGQSTEALAGLGVQRAVGDVRDSAAVAAAVEGCERVYHCAARISTIARSHRALYEVNVLGTRNVLEAARELGVQRVVVTGSFGATGATPGRPSTERDLHYPFAEHTPYTRSKVLAEHECCKAAAQGLEVVIAASTAIIGPHDYVPSRMGRVLLDQAHGRLLAYIPGGFEFVSTADLVDGHLLAMERGLSGHKYLLSTEFRTVDQMMDLYTQVTGRPRPRLRMPARAMAALARLAEGPRAVLAPDREPRFTPDAIRFLRSERRADLSLSRSALGYRPTDIATAIEQAYRCFVDRGLIERRRVTFPAGRLARHEGTL
ncbi:NAD-dependent epimerase/dehydratase family protein [Streptomyces sp. b94]|uniref:NAD-dependent epimerase/dehydratase family protein n=1 Tax=Streptomyces sp. b94 TaxID=1827634 RepID=UPI001B35A3A1|nr:NAD-dependent epimerase/dehydratase family protein [Streptomyces sp. b94]MBQ1101108.1 NAD-dependent epimerase/dehydratase family protein [Streptomyces sp. b94]